MNEPIVIIGLGEMGGVFARAFLRNGYPVYPVLRGRSLEEAATWVPAPACVLVAVGETQLTGVLQSIPKLWQDNVCLLQNELLPRDWEAFGLHPSVISVWFEKKSGQDVKVLMPSPVFGAHAGLLRLSLEKIAIPVTELSDGRALLYQLVLKNLYILSTNIAGLITGGDVACLTAEHLPFAREVAFEILEIQEYLCGTRFDTDAIWQDLLTAYASDPAHPCMGRSAPSRLARALRYAEEGGIVVPLLQSIQQRSQHVK